MLAVTVDAKQRHCIALVDENLSFEHTYVVAIKGLTTLNIEKRDFEQTIKKEKNQPDCFPNEIVSDFKKF